MLDLLFNVPQLKIFLHLTFKFSDSESIKLPPNKMLVSLSVQIHCCQKETLNWGVTGSLKVCEVWLRFKYFLKPKYWKHISEYY